VAAAHAAGYRCIPLPGASSALAALSVAGDVAGAAFSFVGFVPAKAGERSEALQRVAHTPLCQVLFEAPHRIDALVAALASACGTRQITLCRELTKQFETVVTLPADAIPAWLAADANRSRGEFVLVVHALAGPAPDVESAGHDSTLRLLLAELPLKQAVALAAQITGAPRNALYERALALKNTAA
jgi:16S rRNA (cytidine1402-2'-O)-methyltransferase